MFLPVAYQAPPADLVVLHARIWSDGHLLNADCLAIRDGKFVEVGREDRVLIGSQTRVIDAKGRVVLPGMIDSHTHLVEAGGDLKYSVDLRPAQTREQFVFLVAQRSRTLPTSAWLRGYGWSAESWPGHPQPRREWIDVVTGNRPAVLSRMDGHSMLVNSAVLHAAHIDRNGPPNPIGGVIDRDPQTGEPTGMIRDAAMGLIGRVTPPLSPEQVYEGLKAAVAEANRHGVTAVGEICSPQEARIVRRYVLSEKPTLRFALYLRTGPDWERNVANAKAFESVPGWAEVKGLKAFMDGSLGSRTAYMIDPFLQRPAGKDASWHGSPMAGVLSGEYERGFPVAAGAGYQVIVHAIGDLANRKALDFFEKVPDVKEKRCRIEHAQHLTEADIPRFGQLGVIASMQPYHKADDGRYCDEVIGPERSKWSYAYRSLLDHGAVLAFGSDFPVVTINPWPGIDTAVTGRILTGKIWHPEQNITLPEALTAYTSAGAYATFRENEIGSIKPGYAADFVILNRSPFQRGVDLAKIAPAAVYIAGRLAFRP
jgi:predicted amidohydrolase YtcJ